MRTSACKSNLILALRKAKKRFGFEYCEHQVQLRFVEGEDGHSPLVEADKYEAGESDLSDFIYDLSDCDSEMFRTDGDAYVDVAIYGKNSFSSGVKELLDHIIIEIRDGEIVCAHLTTIGDALGSMKFDENEEEV